MVDINKNNCVIYTSLIGQNEGLNSQPDLRKSNFRRICFTDDKDIHSKDWEIIQKEPILPKDPARSQRNLKIRPHLFFPEFKYSLYIDNTILIKDNLEEFISYIIENSFIENKDSFVCLPYHSFRNRLIDEFNICADENLDNQSKFLEQLKDYMMSDNSIFENKPFWGGIILRSHNNKDVINFSETWFAHINRYSRRDQLSLLHSASQVNFKLNGFSIDNHNSKYHQWPITKEERINRKSKKNYLDLIPYTFYEELKLNLKISQDKKNSLKNDIKNLENDIESREKNILFLEDKKKSLVNEISDIEKSIYDIKKSKKYLLFESYKKLLSIFTNKP